MDMQGLATSHGFANHSLPCYPGRSKDNSKPHGKYESKISGIGGAMAFLLFFPLSKSDPLGEPRSQGSNALQKMWLARA
jgi:hypothetical protein